MMTILQHTLDYVDSWLELRTAWSDAPGTSVAIRQGGKTIFTRSYGYANKESKESLTPAHLFQIASQSKTFTATAIMQLQEKRKLRIDDYVCRYLPWLAGHTDARWRFVTIRQLLSHSAGVMRDGKNADYWQLLNDFPSKDELHRQIMDADLVIEPNTSMKYSNLGYALLGEVIAQASGETYEAYIKKHIIDKLGLTHTFVDVPPKENAAIATGYSRPFSPNDCRPLPRKSANALVPAAGFWSTAEDLAVYYAAQMIGSGELLTDESKREMQRVQWQITKSADSYGLGFLIEDYGQHTVVAHGGGFPGFGTHGVVDAENKLSIVVLTNSSHGDPINKLANIFSYIDLMSGHTPSPDDKKLEGRFADFGGVVDIVSTRDGFVELFPHNWMPVDDTTKLEKIDEQSLKFIDANSLYNTGEQINYHFDTSGKVSHIVRGGMTLWPTRDGSISMERFDL